MGVLSLANQTGGDPREEEAMLTLIRKLAADEAAQDLAEYGIALAVIGIIAAAAAIVIAKDVGTLWSQAQSVISSAVNQVAP
jgi:Flp pilus assembly pilin Flp